MDSNMAALQQRVITWTEQQEPIRALLLVGSQARRDHPADEWGDLDLMLFCRDHERYMADTSWLDTIGAVWVCMPHFTGGGDPELLVVFEGGHKVDFVFIPEAALAEMGSSGVLHGVYHRGYAVLLDKDGMAAQLPACPFSPPLQEVPSQAEFTAAVEHFWYGALYVAKQIRRRQLWSVKYRDWTMKETLLTMLEWHARSTRQVDTWHDGKFIGEWTDAQSWDALHQAFGRFDAADSWRALLATLSLFRRLASETAQQWQYMYPALLDERISTIIAHIHQGDHLTGE